jgi:hypothetical protein
MVNNFSTVAIISNLQHNAYENLLEQEKQRIRQFHYRKNFHYIRQRSKQ